MKIDLEMLEVMVAAGATGAMVLAVVRIECERYEAARAARRPVECASKRRTRGGHARTSVETGGPDVDTSGHEVDIGGHQVDKPFDEFWKAYPRRHGSNPRAPAEKLFLIALKAGNKPDEIIAGARAYAIAESAKVGSEFIPQAVKWLRQRCWQDYGPNVTVADVAAAMDWDKVLSSYKQFGHWSRYAGPSPDSPACLCPHEMLVKYGFLAVEQHPETPFSGGVQ
jgi:hypothetical protein